MKKVLLIIALTNLSCHIGFSQTKQFTKPLYENRIHGQDVSVIIPSLDGKMFYTASRDNSIVLISGDSGTIIKKFEGHTSVVTCLSLSTNGKFLISGSDDGSIILWDLETAKLVQRIRNHQGTVWGVAITMDDQNKMFFSVGEDGKLAGYDRLQGGKWIRTTTMTQGATAKAMVMDPYGKTLIIGCVDGSIRQYNVAKDEIISTFEGKHAQEINDLKLSPDGLHLLTASSDKTIKSWSIADKKEENTFTGHTWKVLGVAYNRSQEFIASSSNDGSVRLWSVAEGKEINRFELAKRKTFTQVAFTPDSRMVVAGAQVDKPNFPSLFWFGTNLTPGPDAIFTPIAEPVALPKPPSTPKKK